MFNHDSESLPESFGLTGERATQVQEKTESVIKDLTSDDMPPHSKIVEAVLDTFDDPQECVYALYILRAEESEVAVSSLFGYPSAAESGD